LFFNILCISKDSHNLMKWILTLLHYVANFIKCFTKFWMNLNKFIIVKLANPLVNGD